MNRGIYIHIPFCSKKCPYCDFYSLHFNDSLVNRYTDALLCAVKSYSGQNIEVDTIYFGGGTPNLLGSENISKVICAIRESFSVSGKAEITIEANPESFSKQNISAFAETGINRLSMGLQSANGNELISLGRTHNLDEVEFCVEAARKAGINNISLDLMLGIEEQNEESIKNSIDFCEKCNIEHISAYLLKIEKNTPYYQMQKNMNLPDEETSAELYSFACQELKKRGFDQYEISNFAKNGAVSRHNLKYWLCEEYIGIGPSAHGFFRGERYHYERDIEGFIQNPTKIIPDGSGGSAEEAFMLALRLAHGIDLKAFCHKYNLSQNDALNRKIELFCKAGLMLYENDVISLTSDGFLVSNSIISDLIVAWGL